MFVFIDFGPWNAVISGLSLAENQISISRLFSSDSDSNTYACRDHTNSPLKHKTTVARISRMKRKRMATRTVNRTIRSSSVSLPTFNSALSVLLSTNIWNLLPHGNIRYEFDCCGFTFNTSRGCGWSPSSRVQRNEITKGGRGASNNSGKGVKWKPNSHSKPT